MATKSLPNRRFTTANGNRVTVWNDREVDKLGFWTGLTDTLRTFVENETTGETRALDAGCSFQAERVAAQAGW